MTLTPISSLAFAMLGLGLLWSSGVWLSAILSIPRSWKGYFSTTLFLGFTALGLAVSNLSYVGVPLRWAVPIVAVIFITLSFCSWLKRRGGKSEPIEIDGPAVAITILSVLIFIAPYLATGGFPYYGDSYPYIAGADYLQAHGYHARVTDENVYLWKSGMSHLFDARVRMGIPYMIGIFSGFLGLPGVDVYVSLSLVVLWLCLLGFHNLASTILENPTAQRLALALFSFNIAIIDWGAANGFLPQTIGIGIACMLIASAFRIARHAGNPGYEPWVGGMLLAALVWSYPEILPFILVPLLFALAWLTYRNAAVRPVELVSRLLKSSLAAVVVNPYNSYWMILGFLYSLRGRPQSNVGLAWADYFTMMLGVSELSARPAWALPLAAVLSGIALYGLWRAKGELKVLAIAVITICGPVVAYMGLRDSGYSLFKSLMYSYYVVPLLTAAGLCFLPQRVRLGVFTVWAIATAYFQAGFTRSIYNIRRTPAYYHQTDNAQYLSNFEPLREMQALLDPKQKTLLLVPEHLPATWVGYFLRVPMQPVFPGAYFATVFSRPDPDNRPIGSLLVENARSAWLHNEDLLYRNFRFSLSKPQPVVVLSEEGFYDTEFAGAEPLHWMQDKGVLVAYLPVPATVRLTSHVQTGPHGQPREITVKAAGTETAHVKVAPGRSLFDTGAIRLPAGQSRIELISNSKTPPGTGDTRILNLLFERWSLTPADGDAAATAVSERPDVIIDGLTQDQWVTPSGVEIRLADAQASVRAIVFTLEVPAVNGHLPLNIQVTADGRPAQALAITKPGRQELPLKLTGAGAHTIRLVPEKFFVPQALSVNSDARRLAFRLLGAITGAAPAVSRK